MRPSEEVWGERIASPETLLDKRAIRRGDKGGWMVDDETHGVEISIAGGGEEIVHAYLLGGFCFCFNHSISFKGTNSHAALAMVKKTSKSTTSILLGPRIKT